MPSRILELECSYCTTVASDALLSVDQRLVASSSDCSFTAASDGGRVFIQARQSDQAGQNDTVHWIGHNPSASNSRPSLISFCPKGASQSQLLLVTAGDVLEVHAIRNQGAVHVRLATLHASSSKKFKNAAWHPSTTGLLAAISQAEVLIAYCPDDCADQPEEPANIASSGAHHRPCPELARIEPTEPCHSSSVTMAWADGGSSLLVGWGPSLEIIRFSNLHQIPGRTEPLQYTRSQVLLGVAGPFRALASGPMGSVLGTLDAQLSLASSQEAASIFSTSGPTTEDANEPAAADSSSEGIVDLRGHWDSSTGTDAAEGLGGLLSGVGGSAGAEPASLVPQQFLLNSVDTSTPMARLCVVWPGQLAADHKQTRAAETSPAVAGSGPACTNLHQQTNIIGRSSRFVGMADLMMPRPDLLELTSVPLLSSSTSTAGPEPEASSHLDGIHTGIPNVASMMPAVGIIVVGSSAAPSICQLFGVSSSGLTQLAVMSLQAPGLPAANSRLRGLSLACDPGTLQLQLAALQGLYSAGGGGGTAGRQGPGVTGVAGPSFTSISKAGPGAVRLSPLLCCQYSVPQSVVQQHVTRAAAALPQPQASNSSTSSCTNTNTNTSTSTSTSITGNTNTIGGVSCTANLASSTGVMPGAASEQPGAGVRPAAPASASTSGSGSGSGASEHTHPAGLAMPVTAPAPAPVTAPAPVPDSSQLLASLSSMLQGLQLHMDKRLDDIQGTLQQHSSRLDAVEQQLQQRLAQ